MLRWVCFGSGIFGVIVYIYRWSLKIKVEIARVTYGRVRQLHLLAETPAKRCTKKIRATIHSQRFFKAVMTRVETNLFILDLFYPEHSRL